MRHTIFVSIAVVFWLSSLFLLTLFPQGQPDGKGPLTPQHTEICFPSRWCTPDEVIGSRFNHVVGMAAFLTAGPLVVFMRPEVLISSFFSSSSVPSFSSVSFVSLLFLFFLTPYVSISLYWFLLWRLDTWWRYRS